MIFRRQTLRRPGEHRFHLELPRVFNLADLALSTKLILLVVAPMVLTLAVTLPLTVTGLNRLATETSDNRLAETVRIIDQQFEDFEGSLNDMADNIARDPVLLTGVEQSDRQAVIASLLASSIRLDLQYLEVFDGNGRSLGLEYHLDGDLDRQAVREMDALGLAELETTRIVVASNGWLLMAGRSLKDSRGFIGSVNVGKLIDVDALSDLNFNRSDSLILIVGGDGEVALSSSSAGETSAEVSAILDRRLVEAARSGRTVVGSAIIDGTKRRSSYAPLELGGGPREVFVVSLTTSPVVGLRDQLTANHIMVTAALALLVLGVGYVVTRTITRRILRLRDGAVEIASGNLSFRIQDSTRDEIGTLANEFNRMADSLNEKNSQLEQANRNLEMRVFERTEELEHTNAQLLDAQSQLVRTEKLAAIGELSAGVAHDLRNPLGAIRNGVYFLKARLVRSGRITTDPKIAEFLGVMDERITQCDKIIGDLISFTRISSPTYSPVILSEALENAFWGIETPDGISVIKNYGDEEVEVQADMNQLVRVFTNLIVNAHEAMAGGGTLTVGLKKVGPSAEVILADTGAGMDSETMQKIFDPLFTTKVQGTGLGLAVCQQIIGKHNGKLDVSSKVGVGTSFTVRLPLKIGGTVTAAAPQLVKGGSSVTSDTR